LPKPEKPADFTIGVVNASGQPGLGQQVRDALAAHGFHVRGAVRDDPSVVAKTQIEFRLETVGAALTAMNRLGTANGLAVDVSRLEGNDVVVVLGQDWNSIDAPVKHSVDETTVATSTTASTTTTTTTTTTVPRSPSETAVVPVDPATGGTLVGCP
jgi:hypothetical protein